MLDLHPVFLCRTGQRNTLLVKRCGTTYGLEFSLQGAIFNVGAISLTKDHVVVGTAVDGHHHGALQRAITLFFNHVSRLR